MKIVAIIQARMGSTRLPGKVLLSLAGKPVLEHVVRRVWQSKLIDEVVVATTTKNEDLAIVNLCRKIKVKCFCGSENDVLDRYYQVAKCLKPNHIVRITADCPVIDPRVIDKVIKAYLNNKVDYVSTGFIITFPDGEDIEVLSFIALKKAWKNAQLASEREHVAPYIWKNKKLFKVMSVRNKIDLSDKRWTLDTYKDYEFLKKVYAGLYEKNQFFGMDEILEFLQKNPEIEMINKFIARNEGYLKSLKEDKIVKRRNNG